MQPPNFNRSVSEVEKTSKLNPKASAKAFNLIQFENDSKGNTMKFVATVVAIFSILSCSALCFAELKVEADKENVVASRLEGSWCKDASLSERLNGKKLAEQSTQPVISFKSDPAMLSKLPVKFEQFLKDKKIYMAGICTFHREKDEEHIFLLIEHRGNPHVVWFKEKDGDPNGHPESWNVSVAPANDKENDLLLIGGDFNNESFKPFRRVKEAQPEAAK